MVLLKPNGLGHSPIRGAYRDANVCWWQKEQAVKTFDGYVLMKWGEKGKL